MDQAYKIIAEYSKLTSSEIKTYILHTIGFGELTLREICKAATNFTDPATTGALADLEKRGAVKSRKIDNLKRYSLAKPHQTMDFLNNMGLFALDVLESEKVS